MTYSQHILGQQYVSGNRVGSGAAIMQNVLDSLVSGFGSAQDRLQQMSPNKNRYKKSAAFAGSPNLSEVEAGTWQIAKSYIADKAPQLMNCCLGFQLLKKTDDDSRVCGIFAFKPGDELVYIPVFVISGEVQGHELMYVVSLDQFTPSDEKQINYLLSRKPLEPGKVELRERSEIPAVSGYSPSRMTSGLKLSSFDEAMRQPLDPLLVLDALRTIFKEASAGKDPLESIRWKSVVAGSNLDTLFGMSRKATKLAEAWSRTYPVYGRLLNYALDGRNLDPHLRLWEKKAELAQRLGVRPVAKPSLNEYIRSRIPSKQASAPKKEEKVAVYSISHIPLHQFRFMPVSLIDKIHRDGYYVADTRDQTKLAAVVSGDDRGINNPVGPGLYSVFMADGTFKPFFVLQEYASDDCGPCCGGSSYSQCNMYLLLCPKTKKFLTVNREDIWVAERTPDKDWFSKLPASNASLHTNEEEYWDRHKDVTSILVTPSGSIYRGKIEETGDDSYYDFSGNVQIDLFSSGTDDFYMLRGKSCRLDHLIAPRTAVLRRYAGKSYEGHPDEIMPGNRKLWLLRLMEGSVSMSVQKQRGTFNEQYIVDNEPAKEKTAALEYLMRNHSLSQGTAELLLKEADAAPAGRISRLREKLAFSGEVPRDRLSVTFPQKEQGHHDITGLPVEQELEVEEPVEALQPNPTPTEEDTWPGLMSAETDQNAVPPAPNVKDMQLASQAAASGQKDFVSAQMLMSLLREIDDDSVINKYITIFEKACDTLGRLYMQVLWRTDAFEDRFGKTQLKEFKEMLVSLFQQMGDFICYLRQRDIRPSPVLSLDATDIGQADIS
jgi:hypothetical protein